MIRSADSELAANGCWSLGTTGELRTFRGFAHSGSLTRRDNPAIGGHSHISNGPCAHVPRPHAPSAPSLAEGNGPFKTHRPNCCGAVQSNPSLAHRRGVQDFLSPDDSVAAPPT